MPAALKKIDFILDDTPNRHRTGSRQSWGQIVAISIRGTAARRGQA
jgi:hypothetical protein